MCGWWWLFALFTRKFSRLCTLCTRQSGTTICTFVLFIITMYIRALVCLMVLWCASHTILILNTFIYTFCKHFYAKNIICSTFNVLFPGEPMKETNNFRPLLKHKVIICLLLKRNFFSRISHENLFWMWGSFRWSFRFLFFWEFVPAQGHISANSIIYKIKHS